MASYFIGVDVGTGSARAGVFDLNGRMVGQATRAIEIYRPQADFVEQSSDNIWQAVCNAVRDAINQSDINPIQACIHTNSRFRPRIYIGGKHGRSAGLCSSYGNQPGAAGKIHHTLAAYAFRVIEHITGKTLPAGTNVVAVAVTAGDTTVMKWDALTGMIDLSGYMRKTDLTPASDAEIDALFV